jgi:hypothetical protein
MQGADPLKSDSKGKQRISRQRQTSIKKEVFFSKRTEREQCDAHSAFMNSMGRIPGANTRFRNIHVHECQCDRYDGLNVFLADQDMTTALNRRKNIVGSTWYAMSRAVKNEGTTQTLYTSYTCFRTP